MVIEVPRELYEETMARGLDVEELLITVLTKALNLIPEVTVRARPELAVKYLNEGRG
ncbi:hypothetical protein [Vulcanisaeta sp. JCM 16159]|uniref:hypothetical protein n=1 Tax=Vulcanisaeta sp. JCM 16159 TaxID=1295371 RepID=UPI001FB21794|nr:hypothetical protein [Vulcanisaeta sp. JCM 16159]